MPPLLLGLVLSWASGVYAQVESGEAADPLPPPELVEILSQVDAAASQENVDAVLNVYSANFSSSDGLTYDTLEDALETFWERFSNLQYQTELVSWDRDAEGWLIETVTTVTGVQELAHRNLTLEARIQSRQRLENGEIVEQEILSETSQLTSGENPPTVEVNLPAQVATGEAFGLDAIVLEPLGDDLLLGAAIEESARPESYVTDTPINLEALSAGGLFKVGQAPATPGDRWISTIIIRDDGMSLSSQRLRVVNQAASPATPPTSEPESSELESSELESSL